MNDLSRAIETLKTNMASDSELAWGWHCNLAMPIMDSYGATFGAATVMGWVSFEKQHQLANEAAAHLMQHLFGIDITKDERYAFTKSEAQNYAEFRIAMDEDEDAQIAALSGPSTVQS